MRLDVLLACFTSTPAWTATRPLANVAEGAQANLKKYSGQGFHEYKKTFHPAWAKGFSDLTGGLTQGNNTLCFGTLGIQLNVFHFLMVTIDQDHFVRSVGQLAQVESCAGG
jgi:hypothetical protein